MNDLNPMQYQFQNQFQTMNLPVSQPEATTTGSSSSTGSSPEAVFNTILQEAVTGATKAIATVASRRVAKFVEGRSRLQFLAQSAGWAPSTSSSGSSSKGSSSGTASSTGASGDTSGVNTNDPVYRLITAWGQMVAQNLQADTTDSQDGTTTAAATDQNTGTTTTDGTDTDTDTTGTDTTGDDTTGDDTDGSQQDTTGDQTPS